MCWIQRRLAKQTSNMLCPVEAVGLACMGAPKRARSVHLRAFTLSAPSVCKHFPRCPHSSLPLCSRTDAVGKFNVTPPPPPSHPPTLLPSPGPPFLQLPRRAFVYLLPVSSVRAKSTGLCSRLLPSNSGPCVWGGGGCFFSC